MTAQPPESLQGPIKAVPERVDIYRGWRTHVCVDGQSVVQVGQGAGRLFPNLDKAHDWIDKQMALRYSKATHEADQAGAVMGYAPPAE